MSKKITHTDYSDNFLSAEEIISFLNNLFSEYTELDPEFLDYNFALASKNTYDDERCWSLTKSRIDFLIDHYAVFYFELMSDRDFRDAVKESMRMIAMLMENNGLHFISNPMSAEEEHYIIDLDDASKEDMLPFTDRARMSFMNHSELLGLWDECRGPFDDLDRENIGFIASGFILLLIALCLDDILFWNLKTRVMGSRQAFVEAFDMEPPPFGI